MADVAELTAEVERTRSVTQSAIALINGIAARIEEAIRLNDEGDNSALSALATDLRGNADDLAAAVEANS